MSVVAVEGVDPVEMASDDPGEGIGLEGTASEGLVEGIGLEGTVSGGPALGLGEYVEEALERGLSEHLEDPG